MIENKFYILYLATEASFSRLGDCEEKGEFVEKYNKWS
jgi:hypothetical protein